jgi:ribonuclease P protein component
VKRRFRLTRSIDIKRVRRSGKSYAHPLVVLYVLISDDAVTRIGVSAGLAAGNAVKRNRAKRLLRVAMTDILPSITPGFDLLLVSRSALPAATIQQTHDAVLSLLKRAGLMITNIWALNTCLMIIPTNQGCATFRVLSGTGHGWFFWGSSAYTKWVFPERCQLTPAVFIHPVRTMDTRQFIKMGRWRGE